MLVSICGGDVVVAAAAATALVVIVVGNTAAAAAAAVQSIVFIFFPCPPPHFPLSSPLPVHSTTAVHDNEYPHPRGSYIVNPLLSLEVAASEIKSIS